MTEAQIFKEQVTVTNPEWLMVLLGNHDKQAKLIASHYPVTISNRGEQITIEGESEKAVQSVRAIFLALFNLIQQGITPHTMDFVTAIKMEQNNQLDYFLDLFEVVVGRTFDGKTIRAKNFGQLQYVKSVQKSDVVFGIGPAGTGKTFLAVVMAVQALREGQVKRIILTRPAVEAGENLGFLPGDLKEKVDPYLRPIYDALYAIYGREQTTRLLEREVIEVAPLAYMRGRTLDDAFVILDEAQNTTTAQMKMFLTRLGFGSKMIINGDETQVDLPRGVKSGLRDAKQTLQGIDNINFVKFDAYDVVRHPVVADIIRAYSNQG